MIELRISIIVHSRMELRNSVLACEMAPLTAALDSLKDEETEPESNSPW